MLKIHEKEIEKKNFHVALQHDFDTNVSCNMKKGCSSLILIKPFRGMTSNEANRKVKRLTKTDKTIN